MSALSDYLEDLLIDHSLGITSWTMPTSIHLALFTANTGLEANNPTAEVSTSGTAYARLDCTGDFSAASAGATSNTAAQAYTTATASWGTVTAVAIVDHASNVTWGTDVNVLFWADLDVEKLMDTGDDFEFAIGDLIVSLD